MLKKMGILLLSLIFVLSFTACGSGSDATEDNGDTTAIEEPAADNDVERDFPEGDYEEIGNGTMYVITPSGSSEDGSVPVLYVDVSDRDNILESIELDAWDYDGSVLSYIYIDGMENAKEQLADTQTTLGLTGNELSEGVHVVEVVQFEGDDPAGEIISYRSTSYEVKDK